MAWSSMWIPRGNESNPYRFLFSEDMKAEGFTRVMWEIEGDRESGWSAVRRVSGARTDRFN